jgi:hypothetical protein
MKGRDPMKGRHAVGTQKTSVGKWPGSSAEPASNKGGGITGVSRSSLSRTQQPKPPVLSDAAHTSSDAQKKVLRPPEPFENPIGELNVRANSGPRGAKPGGESTANPKGVYAGKSGSTVTARALPPRGPVGQTNAINQSGQIGGRMGFPPPARKAGDNAFQKVKRNASFYGE